MSDETVVPLDQRPIAEMPFEGGEATRVLLRLCDVAVAQDIEKLGCTGAKANGLTIEQIAELRVGVGGGGVGLPCFVGIDRFCLAHNTIGGLQKDQAQLHPEQVQFVSRELTPVEKGKVELIEAARRKQGKSLNERLVDTGDILSGREMAKGFEPVEGADDAFPTAPRAALSAPVEHPWTCPEHKKTNWACRYCVAQAIVEGPLSTMFLIVAPTAVATSTLCAGQEVEEQIEAIDADGANGATLYVVAANYKRKLAREE